MQKDLVSFEAWEDIGIAIVNSRSCTKWEGPEWFLNKIIAFYYKNKASLD